MAKKTFQSISIRLLRDGVPPADSLRSGLTLSAWPKLENSLISLGTSKAQIPKWAPFLELADEDLTRLKNMMAFGLLFVPAAQRWFAISFGCGHTKLDPDAFEHDFGLRIVLNAVHPDKLRSADIRTPDDNTTSRRTQTARRSDQTAFSIDVERDIVRGLAGEPKDSNFASKVAGSDGLTITRKMRVEDLPSVCAEALAESQKEDYKASFEWIDQIKHVRDKNLISELDEKIVDALDGYLKGGASELMNLAYPVIYEPEKVRYIKFGGYRSSHVYPDMEIANYIEDLRFKEVFDYESDFLDGHYVYECNGDGQKCGLGWRLKACLIFETDLNGQKYVLSAGRWYLIDRNLAEAVCDFFASVDERALPDALLNENEEQYNSRIASAGSGMLCLDRQLVFPTGASHAIEVCDFLADDGALIHIKDQTSSSRLSHLFNQAAVSARVMKMDAAFRDRVRDKIVIREAEFSLTGFRDLVVDANTPYDEKKHLIVLAVLSGKTGASRRLPFFSLVTFRQAAMELKALGYRYEFSWVFKPAATKAKVKRKMATPIT